MDKEIISYQKTASTITGVMLLIAILPLPYGYYILLRWAVCLSAIFSIWVFAGLGKKSWLLLMAIIALLFNPIVPVYLTKGTWVIIDLVAALLFFISIFKLKSQA